MAKLKEFNLGLLLVFACVRMSTVAEDSTFAMDVTMTSEESTTEYLFYIVPPIDAGYWKQYTYASYFKKYMLLILPPLGLVTNTLSLMVFLQKGRRKQNVSLVMSALAVADTFAMAFEWSKLVEYYSGWSLHHRPILCDITYYVTFTARSLSTWYVLLFTTERFISVKFPLKKASLVTQTRMRAALIIISVLIAISQCYFIVLLEAEAPYSKFCYVRIGYSHKFYTHIKFIMRESVGFLIPSLITAALNMGIIIVLHNWSRQQSNLKAGESETAKAGGKGESTKEAADSRSVTIMLVTVSSFSVLVYAPSSIQQIYFGVNGRSLTSVLIELYLMPLGLLNHTCNFFFYCLGGRTFRQDFFHIITCGKVVPKKATSTSVSGTQMTNMSQSTAVSTVTNGQMTSKGNQAQTRT